MFQNYKNTFLASNLLPVIPPKAQLSEHSSIHPSQLGKIPGRKSFSGTWTGFPAWPEYEASLSDLDNWSQWGANIGLNCKTLILGIDLDFECPNAQSLLQDLVTTLLGSAPKRLRSNSNRSLFVFLQGETIGKQALKFVNTDTGEEAGIDILGSGSQFLIHGETSKGVYHGLEDLAEYTERDLTSVSTYKLETFLRHVIEELAKSGWKLLSGSTSSKSNGKGDVQEREAGSVTLDMLAMLKQSLKDLIVEGAPQGQRSEAVSSVALQLIKKGLTDNQIADILLNPAYGISSKPIEKGENWVMVDLARLRSKYGSEEDNSEDSQPKKPEAVGLDTVEGIKARINSLAVDDMDGIETVIKAIARFDNKLYAEALIKALKAQVKMPISVIREAVCDARGHGQEQDEVKSHRKLAEEFLSSTKEAGVQCVYTQGATYFSDPDTGLWQPLANSELTTLMGGQINAQPNYMRSNDYKAVGEEFRNIVTDNHFFDTKADGFVCNQRLLHTPGEASRQVKIEDRICWTANTSPKDGHPEMFDQYLNRTFEGPDKEGQINLTLELMGAAICGLLPSIQTVGMFYGDGQTGKSTILEVLGAIFPRDMVCAIPPHDWSQEYYLAHMAGKLLNLCGEVDSERKIVGAVFKRVVDRLPVTGRHPGGVPFEFLPNVSHLFNVNAFPFTDDKTDAFLRRWAIVNFINKVKPEELDPNFGRKMIEKELPQILNLCLQGAARVKENRGVTHSRTSLNLKALWNDQSNNALMFLSDPEVIQPSFAKKLRLHDVFVIYRAWCKQSGYRQFGKHSFYQIVRNAKEIYVRDHVEFLVGFEYGHRVFDDFGLYHNDLHGETSWDALKKSGPV